MAEPGFEVTVHDPNGAVIFVGKVGEDDDYLSIFHSVNESSRVELRATAWLSWVVEQQPDIPLLCEVCNHTEDLHEDGECFGLSITRGPHGPVGDLCGCRRFRAATTPGARQPAGTAHEEQG